jgi:hypothetical protein
MVRLELAGALVRPSQYWSKMERPIPIKEVCLGCKSCGPRTKVVVANRREGHRDDSALLRQASLRNTCVVLRTAVKDHISETRTLVLDLTNVTYVDSSGLGELVGVYVPRMQAAS